MTSMTPQLRQSAIFTITLFSSATDMTSHDAAIASVGNISSLGNRDDFHDAAIASVGNIYNYSVFFGNRDDFP
jgi:hypothetical protein